MKATKHSLLPALLFCVLASFAPHVFAQGGVPLWTNLYGAGHGDTAFAIAVGNNGDVFVTGESYSTTDTDFATVKYSNGGQPLWVRKYNGAGRSFDTPTAIAVDNSDNVIVMGGGGSSLQTYVTIKYSAAGVPLWTNQYPLCSWPPENALAVDTGGNVFVAGCSDDGSGTTSVTIKYSAAGVPLWTNRDNGGGPIAVDGSGNVIVTGGATIKYSTAGVSLWTNQIQGYSGTAIALDTSGNVFVTGSFWDGSNSIGMTLAYSNAGLPFWTNRHDGAKSIAIDATGNVFVASSSPGIGTGFDYLAVKYSNGGVPLWTNRYDGPSSSSDMVVGMAVDKSGNVFVTGYSDNPGTSSRDYATVAYSSLGVLLWSQRYNRSGNSNSYSQTAGLAVDSNGNVFVTGTSGDGVGQPVYATVKYSSSIPAPVHLDFQSLNNQLVLAWTNAGFNLQSAPAITGTFTNIPGATSPYTNSMTGSQRYFRLATP